MTKMCVWVYRGKAKTVIPWLPFNVNMEMIFKFYKRRKTLNGTSSL